MVKKKVTVDLKEVVRKVKAGEVLELPDGSQIRIGKVTDMMPDDLNLNKGTPRGMAQLDHSVSQLGIGRGVVTDRKRKLIGGNKVQETVVGRGMDDAVFVRTKGKTLVVTEREDLDLDDPMDLRARRLAIADNVVQTHNFEPDPVVMSDYEQLGLDPIEFYTADEIDIMYTKGRELELEQEALAAMRDGEGLTTSNIRTWNEEAIFPGSNKWEIPDLREDMLCDTIPTQVWGKEDPSLTETYLLMFDTIGSIHEKAERMGPFLVGFYIEDHSFDRVWEDAMKVLDRLLTFNLAGAIMPDFSVFISDPVAVQIWAIYRARWVARFWQEAGIKIIPNLTAGTPKSYDFCYDTLPKKPPLVSFQARTTLQSEEGKQQLSEDMAAGLEIVQPEGCLIYGGSEHRSWLEKLLPKGPQYYWLSSYMRVRSERLRRRS